MFKSYSNIKITELSGRTVEIEAEISKEIMAEMRGKALASLKQTIEMDGFRKGNVPEHLIVQKIGEMKIMEEAGTIALNQAYPEILEHEKIDAIGRPEITIIKIAPGNALVFKIKTALAPKVKLADYKKIAKEAKDEKIENEVIVTEKEIDDVVLDVRKNVAHSRLHKYEGLEEENHSHKGLTDADLPEMDEQFLKEIGGFASVDDLRIKIKENLQAEKERKAKDKKRTDILEEIIKNSEIEIPHIIIDSELEKMLAQFKDDIARADVNYTEYLVSIKKSEEDLRAEWKDIAKKRAESHIVLHTIAKEQNITPSEEEIKKEMDHILSHQKEADRFHVRMFVEDFLTNELVFRYLELA